MKRWLIPSKEKTERPAESDGFRGEMFSAACLSCGTRCAYFWWSMGPSSLTTWLSVCICLASLNVWMDLTCHCKVKTQASCQWVIKSAHSREKWIAGRDAGSQSAWGVLRESLYNDVIINAAQPPMFTETRWRVTSHLGLRSDKHLLVVTSLTFQIFPSRT